MTSIVKDGIISDRRGFMKGAAATGMLGAVALVPAAARAAEGAGQDQGQDQDQDLHAPPGLKSEADCRYPVFYENSVPQGMKVVMKYFAALSRRDLAGMADAMQFPFVTFEGTDPQVVNTRDELMSKPPQSMDVSGKGDASLLRPGSYDVMENIETLVYHPVGAGFSLNFTRYLPTGEKVLYCNALFGVTNNDGHWGIEYISTIFQPIDLSYETFDADAVANALHTTQRDHALARKEDDVILLRETTMFPYQTASVMLGKGGSAAGAGPGVNDYIVKGVKSRIVFHPAPTADEITHLTPEQMAAAEKGMQDFYQRAAGGPGGKWGYSLEFAGPKGKGTRVIFAGTNKGHVYSGFSRFTPDGLLISEVCWIGVIPYKKQIWAAADIVGVFGQVMTMNHLNDPQTAIS